MYNFSKIFKKIDDLIDDIKSKRVSVPEIAKKTGIPDQRIYKWRDRNSSIPFEDIKKLAQIIPDLDNSIIPPKESPEFNSALKGLQEEIVSRLDLISEEIWATHIDVRAFGEYQVMKDSQGSESRRVAIMEEIHKLVGVISSEGAEARRVAHSRGND